MTERCAVCTGKLRADYVQQRTVTTLAGVTRLRLQIRRCQLFACSQFHRPVRPEEEGAIALPVHEFGLDVIASVGALRYAEHRSIPEIRSALTARGVVIAERTVTNLQVLWIVRDCVSGEILRARTMLSATTADLTTLLREVVNGLRVPVTGVISDGQWSIRRAVHAALPGVPRQLCHFHYLREAARPIYEADRHAKKLLKKAVRGVRPLERAVEGRDDPIAMAVRGYCAAVRSALTDDRRPPLGASGLLLHQRLTAIATSLERVAQKGGPRAN